MTDKREVRVRATRDQISDFKESMVWRDIKRELRIWVKGFQYEYDSLVGNCINGEENSASLQTHLGDIHGRIATVLYMLQLPDIFLQTLEENKDDDRRDET